MPPGPYASEYDLVGERHRETVTVKLGEATLFIPKGLEDQPAGAD